MATITKPMALDESFNTTESTPRNQADVLAAIESAIRQGFGRSAADVSYDNTTSGLTADDVQEAIDELADEKVDKVAGKGLSTNDYTDEDKEALDNIELDIAGTQTVSGNPLTLTDAAPINAENLVVELEPKQDLHGQSEPYVGGVGKNKLPMTVDGIKAANTGGTWSGNVYSINNGTFTILTDDGGNVTGIKVNGTFNANTNFFIGSYSLSGSYIISGCPSGGSTSTYFMNNEGNGSWDNRETGNGLSFSGTLTGTAITVINGTAVINLIFYPMIRLSTETDPTFAPYSNICPITGYTECEVEDVGVNQWDEEYASGYLDANGIFHSNPNYLSSKYFIPIKPNTQYYLYSGTYNGFVVFYFDDSEQLISYENKGKNTTFTTPPNTAYIKFCNNYGEGSAYNNDISINYPATDTNYHPYQSRTASVTFGQTVYGGSVDVTDGGMDDEWNKHDAYSGWYKASTETTVIIKDIHGKKSGANQIYCNTYKYVANQGFAVPLGAISDSTNSSYTTYVFVNDSRFAGKTIQECQAILESDGMHFVYQVATPTQLSTPPSPLKLLKGTNNISTNGSTINLGYQPDNVIGDVKGEIEKCAVDAEFMQFTDGTDTFTDVNLSLDASFHAVSVVGSKIEQKRFICFEVMDKMGGVLQGILASCIAFTDGAKTPSGTAFRAYIESLQMYVNFRIYGSGGSYTLAYQSETSFSASAFYVRVRMMNNL